jgi:hypothetical protein
MGQAMDYLPTKIGDDISINQKFDKCPQISPIAILEITGPQNARVHRVSASVIFVLIYYLVLVLVLVLMLFFSFSLVLVLKYFLVLVLVLKLFFSFSFLVIFLVSV